MLLNDVHSSSLRVFVVDKAHTKSMVSLSITVCVCLFVTKSSKLCFSMDYAGVRHSAQFYQC